MFYLDHICDKYDREGWLRVLSEVERVEGWGPDESFHSFRFGNR